MRILALGLIGLLCTLLAAPLAAQDGVGQTVHRCVGQHGEIVFSGLPCAENGATDIAAKAATGTDIPAAFPSTCPASRDELRERISIAIGRRDSNALAGLLRWSGVSGGAAKSRLRELAELTQRPLLGVDAGDDDASRSGDAFRVRTGSNESGGVREHTFGISADTGCYWLTW
ncbi:MAG TPA: hypothetical protein VGC55_01640 [Dokdonella sp.]